jgi:hypothetical protein
MTTLLTNIGFRVLNNAELDVVSGGMQNLGNSLAYHGITIAKEGSVGGGDTIDGIPWGGVPGDGSWQTVNGNLPGGGPWGN